VRQQPIQCNQLSILLVGIASEVAFWTSIPSLGAPPSTCSDERPSDIDLFPPRLPHYPSRYVEEVLHPQQELENTSGWACGRPAPMAMVGLDSEDEFQVGGWDAGQTIHVRTPLHPPKWRTGAWLVLPSLFLAPPVRIPQFEAALNWIFLL